MVVPTTPQERLKKSPWPPRTAQEASKTAKTYEARTKTLSFHPAWRPSVPPSPKKATKRLADAPSSPPERLQRILKKVPRQPQRDLRKTLKTTNDNAYLINAQRGDLGIPALRVYEKCVEKLTF